jgi:hypothetical protein
METLKFEELAAFIREWAQVPAELPIRFDTQFERDLGITGDDGSYLLQAVEKHFAVQLSSETDGYQKTFGLGRDEYLFNSESFPIWQLLPFVRRSTVRAFTVGELHTALATVSRSA